MRLVLFMYILAYIYIPYISCKSCASTDSHVVSKNEFDTFNYKIKDAFKAT